MPLNIFKKKDFAGVDTVLVAVSGGGDSLALLFLLQHYLQRHSMAQRLVALTVDHQLRPESAAEAQFVKALCQKNGIEHQTLTWSDAKALSAVSFQARLARYNLLFSAAKNYPKALLMTGHTLNDQAETYQMRLKRGSVRGLAAMPRCSLLMGTLPLIRPLLTVRRERLRQYLDSLGQSWIDDPSNDNIDYERVRIRRALTDEALLEAEQKIAAAAAMRRKQSDRAAAFMNDIKPVLRGEMLTLGDVPKDYYEDAHFVFLIGVLMAVQGGALYLPTDGAIKYLQAFIQRPMPQSQRTTLSGAILEKRPSVLNIWRENRGLPTNDIAPQRSVIWDGRYRIDNNGDQVVHAHAATLAELKGVMTRHALKINAFHFPSLQATCAIRNHANVDIPVITRTIEFSPGLTVSRFMNPFGWMVSGYDVKLYDALKAVFGLQIRVSSKLR